MLFDRWRRTEDNNQQGKKGRRHTEGENNYQDASVNGIANRNMNANDR